MFVVWTAWIGAFLACSDRGPTAPEMGTKTAEAAPAEAGSGDRADRTRHPVVVAPRQGDAVEGVWGSDRASLRVTGSGGTLEILALTLPSGACFGSYADIPQPIPRGRFALAGTYTQLTGVYPGKVDYAAQFSGVVEDNTLTITIAVPFQQQSIGPFILTYGVNNVWTPCLYP